MARLSEIAAELKTQLETITTTAGYEITMGSVNEPDEARVVYPMAEITYIAESPDASKINNVYGFADAEFRIRIRSKLLTVENSPVWAVDAEHDKVVAAMRKCFGINNGALALSYNPVISYSGWEKEVHPSGDIFVPGAVITRWNVRYQYAEAE